jgi:hypothetical protein
LKDVKLGNGTTKFVFTKVSGNNYLELYTGTRDKLKSFCSFPDEDIKRAYTEVKQMFKKVGGRPACFRSNHKIWCLTKHGEVRN